MVGSKEILTRHLTEMDSKGEVDTPHRQCYIDKRANETGEEWDGSIIAQ